MIFSNKEEFEISKMEDPGSPWDCDLSSWIRFLTIPWDPRCEESLWAWEVHSHQSVPRDVEIRICDTSGCPQCRWYLSRVTVKDERGILPRLSPSSELSWVSQFEWEDDFERTSPHPSPKWPSLVCVLPHSPMHLVASAGGLAVEGVVPQWATMIQARWMPLQWGC